MYIYTCIYIYIYMYMCAHKEVCQHLTADSPGDRSGRPPGRARPPGL